MLILLLLEEDGEKRNYYCLILHKYVIELVIFNLNIHFDTFSCLIKIIDNMFDCPICLVSYDNNQAFTFPSCLHTFCKNCLKSTFETRIKEQNVTLDIFKCPGCERLFD